jgi:SpoVK/Ycf46/Vps4 family AAA+-type ATPase
VSHGERERTRAANLWSPLARKFVPIDRACRFEPAPGVGLESVGGLQEAKEEVLTYACAATRPEAYERWGTFGPAALMLIGPPGVGKALLAEAMATHAGTLFVRVIVPELVLQMMHAPGIAADLLNGFEQTLAELPRTTVFFDEVQAAPWAPGIPPQFDLASRLALDFVIELCDRTIRTRTAFVLGSTSVPDRLAPAFLAENRFERVIEVIPEIPDDIVAALEIHARTAEKRAGRALFEPIAWHDVVRGHRDASIGNWVRLLHAVLRRKARCEASELESGRVTTADLIAEVERFKRISTRVVATGGHYL